MAQHPLAGYKILSCICPLGEERTRLAVEVEGFPEWTVEAVVMNSPAGPVVSDLFIYPNQDAEILVDGDPFTFKIGSRRIDLRDGDKGPHGWSGYADDIPLGGIPPTLYKKISNSKLLGLLQWRIEMDQAAERLEQFAVSDATQLADSHSVRKIGPLLQRTIEHTRLLSKPVTRPGRKGNGVAYYLDWAKECHELTSHGNTHVRETLFSKHGEDGFTRNRIRDTLHEARRKGLLTTLGPGKSGGYLTPRGAELVSESDPEWALRWPQPTAGVSTVG